MSFIDAAREGEELARLLLSRRQVTAAQLEAARREAGARGARLATVLLSLEAVDLDTLAATLAEVHSLESAGVDDFSVEPEVLGAVPPRAAIRHLAVPLRRDSLGTLDVAFVDPSPDAVEGIARAAGMKIRPRVAPEPLVYFALRNHYLLAKVPKALEKLVNAIEKGTIRRHAGAIPEAPEEYVTTPMGGVVPHTPDEVTTNALAIGAAPELSPEDILLGAAGDDALGRAIRAIDLSRSLDEASAALLAWCSTAFPAAAVLLRRDGEFHLAAGVGALATPGASLGEGDRSIVRAALDTPRGFSGPVPDTAANALLLEALGREPAAVALLPLSRATDAERLVWVDADRDALDAAAVETLRSLVSRIAHRALS